MSDIETEKLRKLILKSGMSKKNIDEYVLAKLEKMHNLIGENTAIYILATDLGIIKPEAEQSYTISEIKTWGRENELNLTKVFNLSKVRVNDIEKKSGTSTKGKQSWKWNLIKLNITNDEESDYSDEPISINVTDFHSKFKKVKIGNILDISDVSATIKDFVKDEGDETEDTIKYVSLSTKKASEVSFRNNIK